MKVGASIRDISDSMGVTFYVAKQNMRKLLYIVRDYVTDVY